jgi:hypothetical protein
MSQELTRLCFCYEILCGTARSCSLSGLQSGASIGALVEGPLVAVAVGRQESLQKLPLLLVMLRLAWIVAVKPDPQKSVRIERS